MSRQAGELAGQLASELRRADHWKYIKSGLRSLEKLLLSCSADVSFRPEGTRRCLAASNQREAKSRVIEKKPPKAAINLGTDVDAPWGEKIETSRKDNHQIA